LDVKRIDRKQQVSTGGRRSTLRQTRQNASKTRTAQGTGRPGLKATGSHRSRVGLKRPCERMTRRRERDRGTAEGAAAENHDDRARS